MATNRGQANIERDLMKKTAKIVLSFFAYALYTVWKCSEAQYPQIQMISSSAIVYTILALIALIFPEKGRRICEWAPVGFAVASLICLLFYPDMLITFIGVGFFGLALITAVAYFRTDSQAAAY